MKARIEELKSQINKFNEAYRTGNALISDKNFDALVDELSELSPNDDLLSKIGYEVKDQSRKKKLPIIMASMNKIKTFEEFKHWIKLKKIPDNTELIITPKYDGLSLCVNERTLEAWTRGDGEYGQDVTKHYSLIKKQNHTLSSEGSFFSFGEVIMSRKNFEKYKHEFKNPRNLVSGKMNDKHPSDILKDLDYIRYGADGGKRSKDVDKETTITILNAHYNTVQVPYKKIKVSDITNSDLFFELFNEWNKSYELDGIILEINNAKLREELGRETSTNNPCFARAFKGDFEEVEESKVVDITYQISKLNHLKPVAHIEPVELDGALVSCVTAINEKFVVGYGLKKGSTVKVKRSGMVIPILLEIDGVKVERDKRDNYVFPFKTEKLSIHKCPVCSGEVEWNDNKIEAVCSNKECSGSELQRIIAFFEILEVEGVSDGICETMYQAGYNTIEKILKMSKEDMLHLEGFAERKADITYNSIHSKLKGVSLSKLQHASGCFVGLGSKKLELLEQFDTTPSKQEIINIEGFSDISADAYLGGIEKFNKFVKNLPVTIKKTEKTVQTSNDLNGQQFVFTGIRRKDLEQIIESKGGKIGSGVSKNTTVLVMKEKGSGSSKEKKAEELGIRIVTVEELEKEIM
jgi:NAD-dependent DNA ligase